MNRYTLLQFSVIVLILLFLSSCSKSSDSNNTITTKTTAVTVGSISVNSGPYNTAVTINGTGFSTMNANDQVSFNGKVAVVYAASSTQIQTTVPLSAGTGNVTVKANGVTATGPVFTYQVTDVVAPFAGNINTTGSTNGLGTAASLYQPYGLAIDASGNIYVADQSNNLIRKITPAGLVSTLAGSGIAGSSDGTGTSASFNGPTGVALDAAGNVYVADAFNNLIRKITAAGIVSTLAGTTTKGYADGTGSAASFDRPTDLVIDASGNLYVTDLYNYRIRKITPAGVVSTFAGNNSYLAKDGTGIAASFDNPNDIAIDQSGNLYVTEGDNLLRMITANGVVTTITNSLSNTFGLLQGVYVDGNNNIYLENVGQYEIDKIVLNGSATIFAGNGTQNYAEFGPLLTVSFGPLEGIVMDSSGNIYVSEGNIICKIGVQ